VILGISGKAKAGKDLLFSSAEKGGFKKLSFAAELKRKVREDFDLTTEHTDGWLKETPCSRINNLAPRQLLIDLGNLYRKYADDYWIKRAFEHIKPPQNYAFTDVRYWNEAEAIRNHGGLLIRLERHPDRDSLVSEETKNSVSETALDKYPRFDFVLAAEDNKTPEQLAQFWQVVSAVIKLRL